MGFWDKQRFDDKKLGRLNDLFSKRMLNYLGWLRLTLRTGRWRAVGNWRHLRYLALKQCPLLRTEKRKLLFGRLEIENLTCSRHSVALKMKRPQQTRR